MDIRINLTSSSNPSPPPPVAPPFPLDFLLHDYESADIVRPDFAPNGFLPRTYNDAHNPSLPETTKRDSEHLRVSLKWAKLQKDLIVHYAPAELKNAPPKGILRDEDLKGYVVKDRLEEIYLRLNHGNLFRTNHTGWNDVGLFDPLTGAGDSGGKEYSWETLETCGNVVLHAGYGLAWALDGLAEAPEASQIWDMPWFVHTATACYGRDPEDLIAPANPSAPNGVWRVDPFGDLQGNWCPYVFFSVSPNLPIMDWNGLHLRQIRMETNRILPVDSIPCPYQPARSTMPKP